MLSQNKCPQRCRALEIFGSSENAIQEALRNCVAGRLRVLGTKLCQPAQHKRVACGQPTFVIPHCHSSIRRRGWVLPKLGGEKKCSDANCSVMMLVSALFACPSPEKSDWLASGCVGRHDGPAAAGSKGAIPGFTGASNSKLSVAHTKNRT